MSFVEANNYARDYRYVGGSLHNVQLYPIERIRAGESTKVTVALDDTLCVNSIQDTPELGPLYVCRSVRVVAARAGVMTLEALSTIGGRRRVWKSKLLTVAESAARSASRTPRRLRSRLEWRSSPTWKCPSGQPPAKRSF